MAVSDYVVPVLLAGAALYALARRKDVYAALTDGAAEGLKTVWRIFPSLVALLTAVYMFRASGALDSLTAWCAPALGWLGVPPETAGIMLVRPISGSAALAVAGEVMAAHGPDSTVGRTAAVMLGCSETTFYTVAVYFGAARIRRTRHTIPAALVADVTGFLAAAWTVKLFFPE
ncbi:MAG: spore maturation protein [Oscillospiraceae bacterium]|nr:spore maturation protein [Oscillospiraceae bacterium]